MNMFKPALVALSLTLCVSWGFAHHAGVMFDPDERITVSGVVREFQFTNPHSWLIVDVTNDDGSVTTWGFEAEGPTTLIRRGIKVGDFPPGTHVTMTGHPMRDGRPAAEWISAVRDEDGKEFRASRQGGP